MNVLHRIFTYVYSVIFTIFLFGLNFTIDALEAKNVFIIASSFGDTCTWKVQCEQIKKDLYVCHSEGASYGGSVGIVHHVPVGKCPNVDSIKYQKLSYTYTNHVDNKKKILYKGPDTFVYPFVRIIKIQV